LLLLLLLLLSIERFIGLVRKLRHFPLAWLGSMGADEREVNPYSSSPGKRAQQLARRGSSSAQWKGSPARVPNDKKFWRQVGTLVGFEMLV
jgi:hypothetical protein